MFDGSDEACSGAHGHGEQVAQPPGVAGAGVGLVEDAVLAERAWRQLQGQPDPAGPDRAGLPGGSLVDETDTTRRPTTQGTWDIRRRTLTLEHSTHRRDGRDAGSAAVELVLATPVLVLFMLFMVFVGRVVVAMGEVDAAARDAARAASLSRSTQTARLAAERAAAADLFGNRLVACERVAVDVDTSEFTPRQTAAGATAGTVAVNVQCQMRTSDLSSLGLRGAQLVERRATAPVDAFRGTG